MRSELLQASHGIIFRENRLNLFRAPDLDKKSAQADEETDRLLFAEAFSKLSEESQYGFRMLHLGVLRYYSRKREAATPREIFNVKLRNRFAHYLVDFLPRE